MEIGKNTACLEITSDYAKFAIGYAQGGAPVLLYCAKKPIKGLVKDGEIADSKALADVLASFMKLDDESLRLKINAASVSIVVPPLGFEVYQNNKTTNVIAQDGIVQKIDISNVMSLVKKEPVPNGNVIVDIVPDAFLLENGKMYANPPLGEKTNSLTLEAKVHTLPDKLLRGYQKAAEDAGFRINRSCVATYCAASLLACFKGVPESYVYIDMGAHITTVSLIGNTSPFGSLFFFKGGDDLTSDIAEVFGISSDEAESLKIKYGYDPRDIRYQSPIFVSASARRFQKDLNAAIESFFENYDAVLANAIQTIIGKQPPNPIFDSLPILLGGGASLLNGIEGLLKPAAGKHPIMRFIPPVIGSRDPSLINLLGLIVAEGSYRGTLEDNYHGVSILSRDSKKQ